MRATFREMARDVGRTPGEQTSSSFLMRGLTFFLCIAICVSAGSRPSGQTREQSRAGTSLNPAAADALAAFVDRLVPEQLAQRRIAGAVVVLVWNDRVLLDRQYGMADVATGRPMAADTLMRIGSATKTITALAVMQLVEAGKLDLDRQISSDLGFSLPAVPDRPPVTLRRLLSHRTGFEDRRSGIASLTGPPLPLLSYLQSHMPPRLRQDDEMVAYSNHNAALAAALVERASGQPFEEYVADHIFAPLEMSSTTAIQPLPAEMQSRASNGYVRADLPPTMVSSGVATIHEVGSTGVATTGGDMGRLLRVLLAPDPRILSRASLDTMMTPQGRVPHGFIGLGLYSPVGLGGNSFVGHDGGTGSFQTTLAMLPRERFGLFVSYNSDGMPDVGSAPAELVRAIASRFFPEPAIVSAGDGGVWTGAYQPARREDSSLFTLSALLGQFALRDIGGGRLSLGPAAIPIGGIALEPHAAGVYRGGGLELSFASAGSATVMQLGAPVLMYVRVPWWQSARLVMPVLLVSLITAGLTVAMWPLTVRRARQRGLARPRRAVRLALSLYLAAIAAAFWLVIWGWPLAALSSPAMTPIRLAIGIAAWAAIALTPVAVWQTLGDTVSGGARPTSESRVPDPQAPGPGPKSPARWWPRGTGVLQALALIALGTFCIFWRVAVTTLPF